MNERETAASAGPLRPDPTLGVRPWRKVMDDQCGL